MKKGDDVELLVELNNRGGMPGELTVPAGTRGYVMSVMRSSSLVKVSFPGFDPDWVVTTNSVRVLTILDHLSEV